MMVEEESKLTSVLGLTTQLAGYVKRTNIAVMPITQVHRIFL